MQLSFSIDAILGTKDKNQDEERVLAGGELDHMSETTRTECRAHLTCSTPIKEEPTSPRSHTIEWKPSSLDKSPPGYGSDHLRESKCGSKSVIAKDYRKVFQSPPNAHVVSDRGWDAAYSPMCGIAGPIPSATERPYGKPRNLKMEHGSMFASRYLPYPSDALRSHRVHHHPHHYPYSLPFLYPSSDIHTAANPGVFSPNFAQRSSIDTSPRAVERQARLSKDVCRGKASSPLSSESDATRPYSASGSESERSGPSPPSTDMISPTEAQCGDRKRKDSSNTEEMESPDAKENQEKRSTKRGKRVGRRLFTGFQILELEKTFAIKPYLNRMERAYISQKVNLTECQIKTWFQNRRTKAKRRGNGSEEEEITHGFGAPSVIRYSNKPMRIPGYGVQIAPTYGPPDQHLQAAIVDYLRRRSSGTLVNAD